MGDAIENERKITHTKLAEKVEAKLDDQKFLKSQKLGADVRSPPRLPAFTHFQCFAMVPFSDIRSLTRTNSNGPTTQSSKAAEAMTFVPPPSPTQTISTVASSSRRSASDINPTAPTSDGHTSSTQPHRKKNTTTSSCNYKRRCLNPSRTAR